MRRYQEYALEFPSHLELQKLAYFLQEAGQPLRLRFGKALYGPYADNLRHVLNELEGHYVDGYGDGTDAVTEFKPIEVRSEIELAALDGDTQKRLDQVIELCADYASPFGMELLASVHWIAHHADAPVRTASEAADALWCWNPRKRRLFTEDHVAAAWERLSQYEPSPHMAQR